MCPSSRKLSAPSSSELMGMGCWSTRVLPKLVHSGATRACATSASLSFTICHNSCSTGRCKLSTRTQGWSIFPSVLGSTYAANIERLHWCSYLWVTSPVYTTHSTVYALCLTRPLIDYKGNNKLTCRVLKKEKQAQNDWISSWRLAFQHQFTLGI